MKRLPVLGLAALVAGGSAAVAAPPAALPPPSPPPEKGTLMGKLFGPKPTKSEPSGKAGGASAAGVRTPSRPPTITEPLKPEVLADALRAEQEAYLRRVSVCTELRRVALERNDDSLARQADELERQAAALYNARVAGLGVARVKAPLPDPVAGRNPLFGPLDEPASPAERARRLTAPASPVPGTTTAQQTREVPQ